MPRVKSARQKIPRKNPGERAEILFELRGIGSGHISLLEGMIEHELPSAKDNPAAIAAAKLKFATHVDGLVRAAKRIEAENETARFDIRHLPNPAQRLIIEYAKKEKVKKGAFVSTLGSG